MAPWRAVAWLTSARPAPELMGVEPRAAQAPEGARVCLCRWGWHHQGRGATCRRKGACSPLPTTPPPPGALALPSSVLSFPICKLGLLALGSRRHGCRPCREQSDRTHSPAGPLTRSGRWARATARPRGGSVATGTGAPLGVLVARWTPALSCPRAPSTVPPPQPPPGGRVCSR